MPGFDDFLDNDISVGLGEKKGATTDPPKTPPPADPHKTPPPVDPPVEKTPLENPVVKPGDLDNFPDLVKEEKKSAISTSLPGDEKPKESSLGDESLLLKYPEKPPGRVTEEAAHKWGELRRDLKTTSTALAEKDTAITKLQSELQILKDRVNSFEGKEALPLEEVTKLRQEREEMIKELSISRVEATPEYKEVIVQPFQNLLAAADHLAKKYELDENQFKRALMQPDADKQSEALGVLTEGFNDRDKLNVFRMADGVIELRNKSKFLRDNAQVAQQRIEEARANQTRQLNELTKQQWSKATEAAFKNAADSTFIAQERENDPNWNNSLSSLKEMVRKAEFWRSTPEFQAKVLYHAALLPRALEALKQLNSEYMKATERLKKYAGVTPGAGGGNGTRPGGGEGVDPLEREINKAIGFVDAVG